MTWEWVLLGLAAIIVGVSKTSFGGIGAIAVAMFVLVTPAKESTAAVLLLLIVGDVVGVLRYRRGANWRLLRGLLISVIPGLLLGALFIRLVDDQVLKRSIGVILLISLIIQLITISRGTHKPQTDPPPPPRALTIGAGTAAGFTTMAANAAGPVMALYLQLARVDKVRFLGTNAWYFLIVNLAKTPLTAALGLFSPQVLLRDLVLVPFVLVGTLLGVWLIKRIGQRGFDTAVLAASAVAAVSLILV